MKIAITGHTRGLGKAIFDHFAPTHDVIGMSRSTNFDLRYDLPKIIKEVKSCDLFFNNAHFENRQQLLLSCLHTSLPIVTSGSMGADWPDAHRYGYYKHRLEKCFREVIKISSHPMLLLKMGYLENFPNQDFTTFDDVVKAIDFWMVCPKVHVIQFDDGEWNK